MDNKELRKRTGRTVDATVLDILRRYQLRPRYRQGQNFLIDDKVYDDIVKQVVAVELDGKLVSILRPRLKIYSNVKILEKNILAVSAAEIGLRQPYKIVANIPYNITGAIFKKFLMQDTQPTAMTVLVQREVGERIVAKAGRGSLLALSVQLYATPALVRRVPASSFYPSPEVESVILRVSGIHSFPFNDIDEKFFWRVARTGFSAKRKQLHNNLSSGLKITASQAGAVIRESGLAPMIRAEDLAANDWSNIAKRLRLLL